MSDVKWGIVSTIKAPLHDVLGFAAYHLQRGAHRLYIYLDTPDAASFAALKAHPKIPTQIPGIDLKSEQDAIHQ